jgi:hypothetical protein
MDDNAVFMPEHVSAQAANIERAGFAVLGVIIKAIEDAQANGTARTASTSAWTRRLIADI